MCGAEGPEGQGLPRRRKGLEAPEARGEQKEVKQEWIQVSNTLESVPLSVSKDTPPPDFHLPKSSMNPGSNLGLHSTLTPGTRV